MARARRCLLLLAAAVLCGALFVPSAGSRPQLWPRRLFVLVPGVDLGGRSLVGGAVPVAEARDGSIVMAVDRDVLRLLPGGRLRTLGRLTDGVRAIAADRGGAVLALQDNRVVRLLPSGRFVVVAGTGQAGFSGDGGPATSAMIDAGSDPGAGGGIVRAADGSIVFTDSSNYRLRRIRPDGVIETIAGIGVPVSPVPGFEPCDFLRDNGDGGPARLATLCLPGGLLATADGGYIESDTRGHRVRRIAPDGTITTIAGNGTSFGNPGAGKPATEVPIGFPGYVAQLRDGTIVVSGAFGLGGIRPDGKFYPLFRRVDDSGRDFVGRGVAGWTPIAATRDGGLLLGAAGLYFLAPRQVRRALVHISDARIDDKHVVVYIDAGRAARATLRVRLRGRTVARSSRSIGAGRQRLEVHGRFASRRHEVRVSLRARNGTASRDEVPLYLGGTLTMRAARRAITSRIIIGSVQSCTRITRRKVTCTIVDDEGGSTDTATLGLDGVIRVR